MSWIKRRNGTGTSPGQISDTVRGLNHVIEPTSTQASADQVISFTASSTGFSFNTAQLSFNNSGDAYVSWLFRQATKFFDVVTYTGNGSTDQVLSHGLAVEPGLILVKATSVVTGWVVYHRSLGYTQRLRLNLTNAQQTTDATVGYAWGTTGNPTASTFTVGDIGGDPSSSQSGVSYVAYLFAHDPSPDGVIQCGSFTTDASGNATVSTIGWEPQFVLVKAASTVGDWVTLDAVRAWHRGTQDGLLLANSTALETSTVDSGHPIANGFAFKGGTANATYIYMAIRRPNKIPTDATKVFNSNTVPGSGWASIAGASILPNTNKSAARNVDLALLADRDGSTKNIQFYDRVRGFQTVTTGGAVDTSTSPMLKSTVSDAEVTTSTAVHQLMGTSNYEDYVRFGTAETNLIGYAFKRAPGFCDIVAYAGTNSGSATFYHSLGVTPEFVIIKKTNSTGGASSWVVGTGGKCLFLNASSASQGNLAATLGTSSLFHMSAYNGLISLESFNGTGDYVAYLFATCPGVSKVGSYTGNGSTQNIACGFGGGYARFVLIKRTDAVGDWFIFDSARGIGAGSDPALKVNSTGAEDAATNYLAAYASGFALDGDTAVNTSGASYVFLAIA